MEFMNLDDLDLFKMTLKACSPKLTVCPLSGEHGLKIAAAPDFEDIQNIVVAAMGDSALSAELVTALFFKHSHPCDNTPQLWFCSGGQTDFDVCVSFRRCRGR